MAAEGGADALLPLRSECRCVPLTFTHELLVDAESLRAAGPNAVHSAWFGHPLGDPDRWWRLLLLQKHGQMAVQLQLASTEERDGLFARRPRFDWHAAPADARPAACETRYVLKTVDAKVVFRGGRGAARESRAAPQWGSFKALGFLSTLAAVDVGRFQRAAPWPQDDVEADAQARGLIVQVAFTVDYHSVAACHRPLKFAGEGLRAGD